jgi:hypothetical protein
MAHPFHSISFEKKIEECFSPRLSSKSPSPQRDGSLKKRDKKYWKKRKGKKSSKSPANKKGKSIFWEEKNISTSKSFYVSPFSPPHHTIFKTLSKIIWESFIAHFGPSFNLAIYMTWVVSFVFTHELHIFSF